MLGSINRAVSGGAVLKRGKGRLCGVEDNVLASDEGSSVFIATKPL